MADRHNVVMVVGCALVGTAMWAAGFWWIVNMLEGSDG